MKGKALFILVILILVIACGGGNTLEPTPDVQETATSVEQPVVNTEVPSPIPGVTYTGTSLPINALVAFASNRSGNFEIYSSNLDGSDLKQLTDDPGEDGDPEISPDGSKIVFYSTRTGNKEIYVMDVDGSNLAQLTDDPADDQMPTWSPNGKVIAFVSRRSGNSDIYLVSLDGTQIAPYTTWPSEETHPTWSPTDPVIAFMSTRDGDPEIFLMGSDGKELQLTDNNYYDADPDWSPNGRFIVFGADPARINPTDELDTNLYLIEPNGSGLQQVTSTPGFDLEPTWSPDSNYLLFTTNMTGNVDIFLLDEGGTFYRITDTDAVDSVPSWGSISEN
jgi:Tol biopolymer transport system component